MKKILFIALSAVLLTTGCGDLTLSGTTSIGGGNNNNNNGGNTGNDNSSTGNDNVTQTPVSIKVDNTTVSLDLETNTSFKLNAYTASEDGSNIGGVTYISDDVQVANVTSDGTITAVAKGHAFILITSQVDSLLTASVEVIVNEKASDVGKTYEIIVNKDSITLTNGIEEALSSKISISYNPELTADMVLSAVPADKNLLMSRREGSEVKLIPKGVGTTSLKLTVSSIQPDKNDFGYITIPVYIKEAGQPDPVVYPDINPSEADTYKNRIYFKVKFDAFSTYPDTYLYNSDRALGINAITFQNDAEKCNGGVCSGTLIERGNGFINPYGFCEKYGCVKNSTGNNASIAQKNIGTTYYAGNNNLFVTYKNQTGTTNHIIYTVLETAPAELYTRGNISFPINWDEYNPLIHKNIAKFTLTYKDKTPTVVFDGFESK